MILVRYRFFSDLNLCEKNMLFNQCNDAVALHFKRELNLLDCIGCSSIPTTLLLIEKILLEKSELNLNFYKNSMFEYDENNPIHSNYFGFCIDPKCARNNDTKVLARELYALYCRSIKFAKINNLLPLEALFYDVIHT